MNLPGEQPITGIGFTSRVEYREMHRLVSESASWHTSAALELN